MNILIQPSAKKFLKKCSTEIAQSIVQKLYAIKDEPLRHIERLAGHNLWKLRIGDYRAIIFIKTKEEELHVILIGHRKNVYKRL